MLKQSDSGSAEPMLSMGAMASRVRELTGHKPSRCTLWRWHLKGRLAARRIGGRLYTSESAIREMLERDERHNRGSAGSRGEAAASRLVARIEADRRGEVAP